MKKISFVLGAGASKQYGYPLGGQIKKAILDQLNRGSTMYTELEAAGHTPDLIDEFKNALYFADYDTIDQFIAAQSRYPDFQRIGRRAITLCIGTSEHLDKVHNAGIHWYRLLLDFVRTHPERLTREALMFYTFNYDRSLEQYLYQAVTHGGGTFSKSYRDEFFLGNFLHIHGSVGRLPWQKTDEPLEICEYGQPFTKGQLMQISRNILTPDQELELGGEHRERLLSSDLVAIMGFGFHPQNMKRIYFDELINRKIPLRVTIRGLNEDRAKWLASYPWIKVKKHDCNTFIRDFVGELG